jgi:hypothetical protein
VVKSTLKLVSKYDEATKLGLKVFHLQKLSETTIREQELLSDQRFILLKNSLFTFESFKQLSPSQTVAASVALGRLDGKDKKEWAIIADGLKVLCSGDLKDITASHLSVALYWAAKSGNSVCLYRRALECVFNQLLQSSNSWTPLDMGWLLFFLRSKPLASEEQRGRLMRQLAFRFNERLNRMTVRNVACILHEFSKLELLPARAIHRALRLIEGGKEDMDVKSTCLVLIALARLKVFRKDVPVALSSRLLQSGLIPNKKRTSIREVCTILYAMSKLGAPHKPLIESAFRRFMAEPTGNITDADLGMLAFAIGHFGIVSCGPEWARIVSISKERVWSMSPLNLCTITCAVARAGLEEVGFFNRVAEVVSKDQRSFTSRQLVNLVNAYATVGLKTDWIEIPDNFHKDKIARYQINKRHDGAQIMKPSAIQAHHRRLESFLQLNGWKDVELCKQTGSVWADAIFTDGSNLKYAILVTVASDICKLDKTSLLGPIKWKLKHLESRGYIAITVPKKNLQSVTHTWDCEAMRKFIRVERSMPAKLRPKSPIVVDPESGKISFHRL